MMAVVMCCVALFAALAVTVISWGASDSFFYKIVTALVEEMGKAFPELKQQHAQIERILKTEEEQFAKTWSRVCAFLSMI